ncbi:MAG: hypothetical protein ACD_76C00042G0005 [uncultured bacterium]|nr:MAG: hypothetical protein ACD_76C00042G0005 [uncultured bacterium]HBD05459.1 hypothetical protein [Candidatus Uhrbacteria bacterium]
MIEAKDILYIVLAFCALWLTVFFCWLIWQAVSALRNVNRTLAEARDAVGRIEHGISALVERVEKVTPSFAFVLEGGRRLIEYFVKKREKDGE